VHTNEAELALKVAEGVSAPMSVSITDLEGDVERCLVGQARGVQAVEQQATALVAVAAGDGLERILASLGARVVRGGPGANPSVAELLNAVGMAPAEAALLLPNHKNMLPAAEHAAAESERDVRVVPSLSVPQGIAAAAAFNPSAGVDENVEALAEAVEGCSWGEVARAVRDADTTAGPVREGDAIGLAADEPVAVGDDPTAVALDLIGRLREPRHEILTVFWGEGVAEDDARKLEEAVRGAHPGLEVEFHRGDQRGYPYLIGLE
jgi:dihydroxyacetone kinase-like predicted kinase